MSLTQDRFRQGVFSAIEYYDLLENALEADMGNWDHSTPEQEAAYKRGFLLAKISQKLYLFQIDLLGGELAEGQLIDLLEGLRQVRARMDKQSSGGQDDHESGSDCHSP